MRSNYRIFVSAIILSLFISLTIRAQSSVQDYVVDRSFAGTCGITTNDPFSSPNPNEIFKLSNGKYIVVGDAYDINVNSFYILFSRYNANGTTDSAFGTNGILKYTFNGRNVVRSSLMNNDKIYVAGYEAGSNAFSTYRAYIARFNSDGSPDTTFNGNGRVLESTSTNPTSSSFYTHLLLQPDSKIVALGYEVVNIGGGTNTMIARRYDANGIIDTTFHPSISYPAFTFSSLSNIYYSKGIYNSQDGSMRFLYTNNIDGFITTIKLDSLGEPVGSYGVGGQNTIPVIAESGASTIRYFSDSQDNIYTQVPFGNSDQDIRIVKLDAQGNLDSTFAVNGVLDAIDYPATNLDEMGYCLHLDNSGRLWSMGNGSFAFTESKGIIYRYDQSGAVDSTLEGVGYTAITEFPYTVFRNVYFENDNEFVVSTVTNGLLGILKLRLSDSAITIVNSGSDTICSGSQTVLSISQPSNCYSYQWKKDGIDFANFNDTIITVNSSGIYFVVATAGTEVIISDSIVIVEEICSGINEMSYGKLLNVYPNPASDKISITSDDYQTNFVISDLAGKIVKTINTETGQKEIVVSITDLNPGMYMIQSNTGAVKSFLIAR